MGRTNRLAYYEILGDANMMNEEPVKSTAVTAEDILLESNAIFRK